MHKVYSPEQKMYFAKIILIVLKVLGIQILAIGDFNSSGVFWDTLCKHHAEYKQKKTLEIDHIVII